MNANKGDNHAITADGLPYWSTDARKRAATIAGPDFCTCVEVANGVTKATSSSGRKKKGTRQEWNGQDNIHLHGARPILKRR